jgi:hypothetical protein
MNNTLITWVLGAAVAALGLMLLLATPAAAPVDTATSDLTAASGTASASTTYWHDVTAGSAPAVATYAPTSSAISAVGEVACASCAVPATHTTAASTVARVAAARPVTPAATALTTPVGTTPGLRGGCGTPAVACAEPPCGPVTTCGTPTCSRAAGPCAPLCGQPDSCVTDPCDDHPRINRNGPSCVDECTFIQFYSTVPLPVCRSIRFTWAATRGEFLDPTSPTPVYYAPTTGFPGGEDVLITLTVKDAHGIEYSDQMKLHVNDVN